MPFSTTTTASEEDWDKIYTNLFKPIIEKSKFGYVCKRSELENGSFTRDIIIDLRDAYVVLADITDYNPNVMWELGVRHSLSKRTIMTARSDFIQKIPADIREYGVIPYDTKITSYKEFEEQLTKILQKIENEPEKPDSPVFNFLKEENLILSSYGRKQIINRLVGLMTEIGENLDCANKIRSNSVPLGDGSITALRYHADAIEKILIENYVNGGKEYSSLLQSIRTTIHRTNYRLELLTVATDEKYKKEIKELIIQDGQDLSTNLTKLMRETKNLYGLVKSNTLKDEEPAIIISEELSKQFFD